MEIWSEDGAVGFVFGSECRSGWECVRREGEGVWWSFGRFAEAVGRRRRARKRKDNCLENRAVSAMAAVDSLMAMGGGWYVVGSRDPEDRKILVGSDSRCKRKDAETKICSIAFVQRVRATARVRARASLKV